MEDELKTIKEGNHPQFVYNTLNERVECRCGHPAPFVGGGYICGTVTAYPCKYCKQHSSQLPTKEVMQVDVYAPFAELANEESTWIWIESYSDDIEYEELDLILRFISQELKSEELPVQFQSLSVDELQMEYKNLFPVMFGKVLQKIGKELESGGIEMKITGFNNEMRSLNNPQ